MGKADLLRAELEVAEAEEALVKAKKSRKVCDGCGRTLATTADAEKKIVAAKTDLREKRQRFRQMREKTDAVT